MVLEPVCSKKRQKIVPDQLLVWGVGDLKDSKLILNETKLFPMIIYRISLVPFRTFRKSLFPKAVTGQELFFAISYSKLALESKIICKYINSDPAVALKLYMF